ncbi:hypothetical protein [Pseudomonas abietaniphila]|uniref:hypothetical protein n=1 Tax=Pseudomonas abietaniphila TaxID=89065 RepID=UPI00115FC5DD|nr:hypothetical protein [Pseudomonas abietaniphila]
MTLQKLKTALDHARAYKRLGDAVQRRQAVEDALFYRHVHRLDQLGSADYVDPTTCRPAKRPE